MSQPDLNLRDYLRIIRRRRYYLIVPPIVLALVTYLRTPAPTVTYHASSSVKISQTNTMAGLLLQVFTYSPGDNIATQTNIVTSLPMMARLAQYLERIPSDLDVKDIMSRQEFVQVLSELQSRVSAEQVGSTSIIRLTAEAATREDALAISNGLADVFAAWSLEEKNRQVVDARRFIGEQLAQAETRLKKTEERLQTFMEQHLDRISLAADELSRLQQEREGVAQLTRTLELQVSQLKARGSESADRIDWISSSELNDTNLQRFNDELIELQLQKERLLVYQTESSPEVRSVEGKIQTLVENLIREYEDTLTGLERRKAELDEKIAQIPANDAEINRLRRDQQVANDAYTLLKSKHEEAAIREAEKIREVTVVEYATTAAAQPQPGKLSKSLVGALVGLLLGFVGALASEYNDTSIGTIEDVESYLQLPVLGVIPHIQREEMLDILSARNPHLPRESLVPYSALVAQFDPKSPVAEAYRSLRTNIEFSKLAHPAKTFVVTSSTLEEGKSTTVANLAIAMAQGGKRILVVESDLRRPSINTYFGLAREPGLSDVLLGTVTWRDALRSIADVFLGKLDMDSLVRTPGLENISFLTSGTLPPNPAELLGSAPMKSFIDDVAQEFDVVLFDSPPVLPVTDAAIIASRVDGVLIVYQLGRAGRGLLKRAKSHLEAVHSELRGVVLNDIKAEVSEFSPAEYYYQYYSRYGRDLEPEAQGLVERALEGVRGRFGRAKAAPVARHDAPRRPAPSDGGAEYEDVVRVTRSHSREDKTD